MTFSLMAAIAAYLAIGVLGTLMLAKDEFRKIPRIWENEHPLIALGFTCFITVMFIFGIVVWPLPGLIILMLDASYLLEKYKDK